jgi:hypothetical protein
MRIFSLYIILLVILVIPTFYYIFIHPQPSIRFIFLRLFILVEYISLSLFFASLIENRMVQKLIKYLIFPFLIVANYDYIFGSVNDYSYIPLVVECISLLCIILFFFYEKMRSNIVTPAYQTNAFWIAIAFTLYCAGNFFLFLYSNNVKIDNTFLVQYTIIYCTFTISKNIFISIGLTINQNDKNSKITTNLSDEIWEIPSEYKKNNL